MGGVGRGGGGSDVGGVGRGDGGSESEGGGGFGVGGTGRGGRLVGSEGWRRVRGRRWIRVRERWRRLRVMREERRCLKLGSLEDEGQRWSKWEFSPV
ncbi:hypothetical protein GUJ93_ZPchr0012g20672 [Zizania palustris]|uniref:Uncharacterized protein n=1 Tax=Zizania palustris TaxID=103762 RepID=A0A8J6BZT2_ZIZPA|nr:hypothetical protein GUJ93_ZPchr0012g20672 [Zizania palustris]